LPREFEVTGAIRGPRHIDPWHPVGCRLCSLWMSTYTMKSTVMVDGRWYHRGCLGIDPVFPTKSFVDNFRASSDNGSNDEDEYEEETSPCCS
jgi:hypothetical protein